MQASGTIGYLVIRSDGAAGSVRAGEPEDAATSRLDGIVDTLVARYGGVVRERREHGIFASFEFGNPLECALAIQDSAVPGDAYNATVMIGVHVGAQSEQRAIDRLIGAQTSRSGEGGGDGRILASAEAVAFLSMPENARVNDLGFVRLRGEGSLLHLYDVVHPSLRRGGASPLRGVTHVSDAVNDLDGPLFGREREVARISALLNSGSIRLLTLVGRGGSGKTRMAARIAADCAAVQPVWVVASRDAKDNPSLASAIARAVRLALFGPQEPETQLRTFLSNQTGLVVLDNVEDVQAAVALIGRLLDECPTIRVLATSRLPLGWKGEVVVNVRGMETPGSGAVLDSAALRLFEHHARKVRPGFSLNETEFQAFRDLCSVLDGSPLGMKLAAQWVNDFSIREIAERTQQSVDLISRPSEPPAGRPGSLRTVFETTWRLLSDNDRSTLARVSICAESFDEAAALRIGECDGAAIARLRVSGMLEQQQQQRLAMHPLVHAFAKEQLDQAETLSAEANASHARYYLAFLRERFGAMASAGYGVVLDEIEAEATNIERAWRYALDHDRETAERSTEAYFYALSLRAKYAEGLALFPSAADDALAAYHASLRANMLVQRGAAAEAEAQALAALDCAALPQLARAHALHAQGLVAHLRGQSKEAIALYQQALAFRRALNDAMGCYFSHASLAVLRLELGRLQEARLSVFEARSISERLGNDSGTMIARYVSGEVAAQEGRSDDARADFESALEIEETMRHPQHRARILIGLGAVLASGGDHDGAMALHTEAHQLATELGDRRRAAYARLELGVDLRLAGQVAAAKTSLLDAIRSALVLEAKPLLTRGLLELALVEATAGDHQSALRLAMMLHDADLGPHQTKRDELLRTLPAAAFPLEAGDVLVAAKQVLEEEELAELRRDVANRP